MQGLHLVKLFGPDDEILMNGEDVVQGGQSIFLILESRRVYLSNFNPEEGLVWECDPVYNVKSSSQFPILIKGHHFPHTVVK